MDWETLYCPNQHCRYYGVPFPQSRLVRNGTYRGQAQGLCQACHRSISLRYGTAYFGLESDPAVFETAVRALAEGNSIRAPVWRIVLAFVIGKRTQQRANLLLDRVVYVTDDHIPFFTSDQLSHYQTALLHTYGVWHHPQRQGQRGPHPKPRLMAPPNLLYAQVVKQREKGRVVAVETKIVFGTQQAIAAQLTDSLVSQTINTSFVERDNLTQRQNNRRLTRRTNGFSKEMSWFEKQLWLSLAYYHLVLPHHSLRQPLPEPEITRGTGTPRKWKLVTPAMVADITDHVWTTTELLSYRVPLHFLETLSKMEHLFPSLEQVNQGK